MLSVGLIRIPARHGAGSCSFLAIGSSSSASGSIASPAKSDEAPIKDAYLEVAAQHHRLPALEREHQLGTPRRRQSVWALLDGATILGRQPSLADWSTPSIPTTT